MRTFVSFPQVSASREAIDPFKYLENEVERWFYPRGSGSCTTKYQQPERRPCDQASHGIVAHPRLDVVETDKEMVVTIELPGVAEEDVHVEVQEKQLTIKGEKKQVAEKDEKGYHIMERHYGTFERALILPFIPEADKIKAVYSKGVLSLTVQKPESETKTPRKVAITSV